MSSRPFSLVLSLICLAGTACVDQRLEEKGPYRVDTDSGRDTGSGGGDGGGPDPDEVPLGIYAKVDGIDWTGTIRNQSVDAGYLLIEAEDAEGLSILMDAVPLEQGIYALNGANPYAQIGGAAVGAPPCSPGDHGAAEGSIEVLRSTSGEIVGLFSFEARCEDGRGAVVSEGTLRLGI